MHSDFVASLPIKSHISLSLLRFTEDNIEHSSFSHIKLILRGIVVEHVIMITTDAKLWKVASAHLIFVVLIAVSQFQTNFEIYYHTGWEKETTVELAVMITRVFIIKWQ